MAPSRAYALAEIYTTQVKSPDEAAILVEAGGFAPARWFLEQSAGKESDDHPPNNKKRKIRHVEDAQQEKDEQQEAPELVPLFEVVIDFYFPEHISNSTPTQAAIEEHANFTHMPGQPVVPYGFHTDEAGTRLQLRRPHGRDSTLFVESSNISQDVTKLLIDIAYSGQPPEFRSSRRAKDHPATVLDCTLTRSTGMLHNVLRLKASLSWRSTISAFPAGSPVGPAKVYEDYETLVKAFPDEEREHAGDMQPFSPEDFYESVHVPNKDIDTDEKHESMLESELYPFQKRALTWMLGREGVSHAGEPGHESSQPGSTTRQFYKLVADLDGAPCWVNHLQGIISREAPQDDGVLSGGMLCEEMGLGKSVELMALMISNARSRNIAQPVHDLNSNTDVTPSRATLIVAPSSLTSQWKSELTQHAPALKVQIYEGVQVASKKAPEQKILEALCEDYDVVITTYNILAKEVHFAEDPPDRGMRHVRRFERKRSPLVQIQWWRVCLDEAQLVESGVTSAARVACRIPRVHSWAVSGTPLRKDVQDLLGLLIFLRYRPFSDDGKLWPHLLTNHRHLFRDIFSEIALRHTKAHIRDELHLPPQKRVVVTVPFSVIEQQNYTTLFNKMCEEVGLNQYGVPSFDDWNPDDPATVETMRSWLVRLRQTCLHPQVGVRNRQGLGRNKAPLRTVAEVLELMIEQNGLALRMEERARAQAILRRGHILGNNREDDHRAEKACEVYRLAMSASEQMVEDARQKLAAAEATDPRSALLSDDNGSEDSSSDSMPLLGRLRSNLRLALQLMHQCSFFLATAHYQIKTNKALTAEGSESFQQLEAEEARLYETAKLARKEILKDTHRKADALMVQVKAIPSKGNAFTKLKDLPSFGGIESRRIAEKSDSLFEVMRESVGMIKEWRSKIAEFLLQPLVDEDHGIETTGDEYEDSTKVQEELYTYIDALKAIHADLNFLVAGETSPLIDHEIKTQLKGAIFNLDPENAETEWFQSVIGREKIVVKLFSSRMKVRDRQNEVGSVRGLIQEARTLESSLDGKSSGRTETELSLVKQHITHLQAVHTSYSKAVTALEKEIELFRNAQNQRLDFYRHLQELSDDVSPYKEELDEELDLQAFDLSLAREEEATASVAQLHTKTRFLISLRNDSSGQSGPRTCSICIAEFERGVLTVCGHHFCKDCLAHWMLQRPSCPMCKHRLSKNDVHEITFKPREMRAQEEIQSGESSTSRSPDKPSSARPQQSIYTDVDSNLLEQINKIDLPASYGTKIDTIGRHLHWIRQNDPGTKSVVFSQYREFLDVLATALSAFKIGFARLGRSGSIERFRKDASVECLLLDAKTDSSGLTLVNATHVFICEPLIQTAVELQAIARVHRIGQTRATTVWMYLINDTVEEAIYEISVARRLAHVQSRQQQSRHGQKSRAGTPAEQLTEHAFDAANSDELQSAALSKLLANGNSGGELVSNDDLWQCLFGKASGNKMVVAERTASRHLRASAAEVRATLAQ